MIGSLRRLSAVCIAMAALSIAAGCATAPPRGPVQAPPEAPVAQPAPPGAYFMVVAVQPGDSFGSLAQKHLLDSSRGWVIADFNGADSLKAGESVIIPLGPYERGSLSVRGYGMVPVLCYHKFTKGRGDLTTVTEKAFEEQMRYLKENDYQVITLDDFFDYAEFKREIPRKAVVITMDDGWRSVFDIALPILRKYHYPATMFVYTDFVTKGSKALDWDMLKEMTKWGIDVQCHTKTHRRLDKKEGNESFREYFEAVKKELVESSRIITQHLGTEVRYLAYPYGDTNNVVIALLIKLGYRGALTVDRGSNPFFVHPYRVNRSMVYGTFDLEDFNSNLKTFGNEALR
jgi:peptidoglycan/xylan/chitin deacetylase (PgdA/CDA1 family)